MSQRVGVVLAGGRGSRLGRNKGVVEFEGQTLAARAAAAVWPFCAGVLVSIPAEGDNPVPGLPTVRDDPPPGRGPLAGIDAAFRATGEADLLVLACDYPRVEQALLRRLLGFAADDAADIVLMTDTAGRDHPLVALWRRRTHPFVVEALAHERYMVRALLPDLQVRRVGPAECPGADLGRILINVNWPADLKKLRSGPTGSDR